MGVPIRLKSWDLMTSLEMISILNSSMNFVVHSMSLMFFFCFFLFFFLLTDIIIHVEPNPFAVDAHMGIQKKMEIVCILGIVHKTLGERSNVDNVKLCPHAHTYSLHHFFLYTCIIGCDSGRGTC